MIEIDRTQLLRTLDERHDALVRQLDELNERIEQTLARCHAATPAPAPIRQASTIAPPRGAVSR
jgi:hypothetical protein